jgi:hypothetical protein
MCSKVICKSCKKPTWSGCGEHVEEALAGIPISERCAGHSKEQTKPGFMAKLFGRSN